MNSSYVITSRTVPGKKYNVCYSITEEFYNCDCPDFFYRRKDNNEMCKHIELIKELDDKNVSLRVYKKNGIILKNTLFD